MKQLWVTRLRLFQVARILVAVGILWILFHKFGGIKILESLLSADPIWVATAAASCLVSIAIGAYQWYLLLQFQGVPYTYYQSFRTYYAGLFINNFLPSTVGGDALRVYEVQKNTVMFGRVVAATFLDRFFGFCILSIFSVLAVVVSMFLGTFSGETSSLILSLVLLCFGVFLTVFFILFSRRVASVVHFILQTVRLTRLDNFYREVKGFSQSFSAKWRKIAIMLMLSTVIQVLRINVHWFSAIGLGIAISPLYFFSFIPIIALAGLVPLNVGGWGIPQSIGTLLYTLPGVIRVGSGVPGSEINTIAASLAFLPSVIGLVVMLFGGFYFVFQASTQRATLTP